MAADYRVLISPVTSPEDFVAELPFSSFNFADELNGPGAANVLMPLRPTRPGDVEVINSTNLDVATHCLWLERAGVLVWGGIIWDVAGSVAANSLTLGASGFHSYSRHRNIRQTLAFSSVDQLTIARDLVDSMEGVAGSLGLIGTTDTNTSGRTRTRRYESWDRKNYGQAIEQLAEVEDGFDWRYAVSYVADVPTVEFQVQYPALGRATDFVFDLGSNVELLDFTRNGSSIVNEADALGQGEGPDKLIRTRTNPAALATQPLLQAVTQHGDISEADTLSDHAGRTLSRGSSSADQYMVRLDPSTVPVLGSYLVGDIIRLKGSYGYLSVDGDFRIVRRNVSVGQGGGEVVDVTVSKLVIFQDV